MDLDGPCRFDGRAEQWSLRHPRAGFRDKCSWRAPASHAVGRWFGQHLALWRAWPRFRGTRNPGAVSGLANGTATPDGALLNDLWKYNIGTGQWTWVSGGGATGLADQSGVYGTQQVPAAANVPGSRWGSVGFIDPLNNIWLISGWGYGSTTVKSTGYVNDVWQYIQSTGQWIWWKGSSDVNQAGSFPTDIPPSW